MVLQVDPGFRRDDMCFTSVKVRRASGGSGTLFIE
jgi:hypothetical protein